MLYFLVRFCDVRQDDCKQEIKAYYVFSVRLVVVAGLKLSECALG